MDLQLVGNLGSAQNGNEGSLGVLQSFAHHADLFLDQVTANGGQIVGHAGSGSMGTVGGAKASFT